ncbi:hypothetical protein [Oleisolibacter albus]|uniref:hypothetical protein n=1 Tax=Oleisolibacter albus TaxID=2171757 RepID=UPI0012D7B329|nr:hypothetical protein [Oleisolibacter albus]
MQAMHCRKIIAFVEGSMERLFINNNFPYIDVIPILNGESWTIEALCKQVSSKFAVKNINADRIIIWVDKERQRCTSNEVSIKIKDALVSKGANPNIISVCIPDRMTENIILADECMMREYIDDDNYQYKYEGQNGKSILSSILLTKGKNYKPISEGVMLLKKVRLSRSAENSKSAKLFLDSFCVKCWWIGP